MTIDKLGGTALLTNYCTAKKIIQF